MRVSLHSSQEQMAQIALQNDRRTGQHTALRQLLPHLWPAGDWDLRARVVLALSCLVAAKVANVYVPIFFKGMVDSLSPKAQGAIAFPVAMLLSYGLARVMSQSFA